MLRCLLVAALAACTAGEVKELQRDGLHAALFGLLHKRDAISTLLIYDTTHPAGVYQRNLYAEACEQTSLYADCYALDKSLPALQWVASAYGVQRGDTHRYLLFPATAGAAKEDPHTVARPGGLKKPQTFEGHPSPTALKQWVQTRTPEPRGMKRSSASSAEGISEYLRKQGLGGERVLVLVTDKDKVTPALRAVVLRSTGHSPVVFIKASGPASKFGLDKLPALTLYKQAERVAVFSGKLERGPVEEFLEKEAGQVEALIQADTNEVSRAGKRFGNPVVKIETSGVWEGEVVNPEVGLVLVAFLDEHADDLSSRLAVLAEVARLRSSVRGVFWLPTASSQALMNHFGVEPESVVFITAKHSKYTRFAGAFSAKGLKQFIEGPLVKSRGARNLGSPPGFGS